MFRDAFNRASTADNDFNKALGVDVTGTVHVVLINGERSLVAVDVSDEEEVDTVFVEQVFKSFLDVFGGVVSLLMGAPVVALDWTSLELYIGLCPPTIIKGLRSGEVVALIKSFSSQAS